MSAGPAGRDAGRIVPHLRAVADDIRAEAPGRPVRTLRRVAFAQRVVLPAGADPRRARDAGATAALCKPADVAAVAAAGLVPVTLAAVLLEGEEATLETAWHLAAERRPRAGARTSGPEPIPGPRAVTLDAAAAARIAAPALAGAARVLVSGAEPGAVAGAVRRLRAALPAEVPVGGCARTAAEALALLAAGADDLGDGDLRAGEAAALGARRDELRAAAGAAGVQLVERSAVVADGLGPARLPLLDLVDAQGLVRPDRWASGVGEPPPRAPGRRHTADALARGVRPALAAVLDGALAGERPEREDVELLLSARGEEVDAVCEAADVVRRRRVGDVATFVVTRNIQYTNKCTYRCGFCAFSRGPRSLELRDPAYLLPREEVVARAVDAWRRGATEVCMQGGIHPSFTGDYYLDLCAAVKEAAPGLHVHAFSPLEITQGARTLGLALEDYLGRLRDAGLASLPGTAAEVLDDEVRAVICPDKLTTGEWLEVQRAAASVGLRSNATLMFGHVDGPRHWAAHFDRVARLQRETGHLTELVPLPFVHMGAPIHLAGRSRPGPTWDETLLVHAVARLALQGLVDNVQVSWVKLGAEGARRALAAGVNDLGGTLMNESISRSAGASHGQELDAVAMERLIRSCGRVPRQRTTLYGDPPHERLHAARAAAGVA